MHSKVLIAVGAALLLAGCNAGKNKVLDKPVLHDRAELIVPSVQPVTQNKMDWVILTPQNVEVKMRELSKTGNVTYFALTPQGYQNLSMNVAELRRYIEQQNAVIAAYKTYYKNEKPPEPEKKK